MTHSRSAQPRAGQPRAGQPRAARRAFTITELLVVVGILAILAALLFPALRDTHKSGKMTESMSNMREIAQMMRMYTDDNRDSVLPSQFNHHLDAFPGHPRCNPAFGAWHARGTWADLLWTQYEMGVYPDAITGGLLTDYRFDSPDKELYELKGDLDENILRSTAPNSRDVVNGTGPTPFGDGAQEAGLPGYFAANNFFNDDDLSPTYNGRFTYAQIRGPARSMYLVDSVAGEVIETEPDPFENDLTLQPLLLQVDFRYSGNCLMLFLDGHVATVGPWQDLDDLEQNRPIRVRDLDRRAVAAGP